MSRLERHPERHLVARIGWLRAAVLGANDGLVSTASLVVGVAAAEATRSGVLIAGGGHAMAAGVSVSEDKLDVFRIAFCEAARNALTDEALSAVLEMDAEIRFADLTHDFLQNFRLMEPFGQQNSEPVFLCRRVTPRLPGRTMKDKHLRVMLTQDGVSMEARWFNAPLQNLPKAPWDIAMRVQRNVWRGDEQWQLTLDAVRSSE